MWFSILLYVSMTVNLGISYYSLISDVRVYMYDLVIRMCPLGHEIFLMNNYEKGCG